jgi:hypothetical protein
MVLAGDTTMTTINRSLDTNIGPRFLAISHESLIEVARSVTGATNPVKVIHPRGNPDKLFLAVDLKQYETNVPALGGTLVPRLWMRNHNDGTRALQVGLGFFRLVCSNGLTIPIDGALFTSIRHLAGPKANTFLDTLPDILMTKMDQVKSGALVEAALGATKIAVEKPLEVLAQLSLSKTVKDIVSHNVSITQRFGSARRAEDDINTAWGLYNEINEIMRINSRSQYAAVNRDVTLLNDIITIVRAA